MLQSYSGIKDPWYFVIRERDSIAVPHIIIDSFKKSAVNL